MAALPALQAVAHKSLNRRRPIEGVQTVQETDTKRSEARYQPSDCDHGSLQTSINGRLRVLGSLGPRVNPSKRENPIGHPR